MTADNDAQDFSDLRTQAAINLVQLLNMARFDSPHSSIQLQAKYFINDIIRAVTQAQIDCMTNGLKK